MVKLVVDFYYSVPEFPAKYSLCCFWLGKSYCLCGAVFWQVLLPGYSAWHWALNYCHVGDFEHIITHLNLSILLGRHDITEADASEIRLAPNKSLTRAPPRDTFILGWQRGVCLGLCLKTCVWHDSVVMCAHVLNWFCLESWSLRDEAVFLLIVIYWRPL